VREPAVWTRFKAYLEWRRKDREEIVVATGVCTTEWTRDSKAIGLESKHVLVFLIDGNGVRYTRTETVNKSAADTHNGLVQAKANWKYHGELPPWAVRAEGRGGANLIAFPGGKAS
jgi:hypothetical protein